MTLTEIKAKAVEKVKLEEAARAHENLIRELDVHPLVKLKTERSVRDAYFYGIVFAALLDDLKVDSAEFKIASRIGNSLEIDNSTHQEVVKEVEQTIAEAVAAGGLDVDVLLKETLSIVSDEHARLLFLAEFVKVCGAKELHVADVESILAPCMPELKKKEAYFKTVCKIVQEGEGASRADLLRLAEDLTDDEVRYWMLDVKGDVMDDLALERQAIAQAKKVEEKQRQAEAKRLAEEAKRAAERKEAEQRRSLILSYSQNMAKICADNYFYRCEYIDRDDIFKLRTDLEEMGYVKSMTSVLLSEVEKHLEIEGTGSALINAAWELMGVMSLVKTYYSEDELRTLSEVLRRTIVSSYENQDYILSVGPCWLFFGRRWLFQMMEPYCKE